MRAPTPPRNKNTAMVRVPAFVSIMFPSFWNRRCACSGTREGRGLAPCLSPVQNETQRVGAPAASGGGRREGTGPATFVSHRTQNEKKAAQQIAPSHDRPAGGGCLLAACWLPGCCEAGLAQQAARVENGSGPVHPLEPARPPCAVRGAPRVPDTRA